MVKANELRIGSLVNVPNSNQCPFRIDCIDHLYPRGNFGKVGMYQKGFENAHPLTWYLKDLEPIPLTEEWLLKFGFSKPLNSGSFYWIKLSASLLNINPDNGVVCINNPIGEALNKPCLVIHVHQLQNYYYALTDEELIITE